jgi:pyruvate-ferredoxin/flavodoxin oxidoreductase
MGKKAKWTSTVGRPKIKVERSLSMADDKGGHFDRNDAGKSVRDLLFRTQSLRDGTGRGSRVGQNAKDGGGGGSRTFSTTPANADSSLPDHFLPGAGLPPLVGTMEAMDGNTAAVHVAYAMSETAFIYPISPATSMGETMDAWSTAGRKNVYGQEVAVTVMQSEAGAAGAVHGSLVGGANSSTFTASQGLLLMIPNLYLIAGELMPSVFHVSARTVAKHALSIFNDHSDVMACRATGFAMLCSNNVQESMDLALVSHLATIKSRVPFMHFFDGYRVSAQINKINVIPYEEIQKMIPREQMEQNLREVSLNPNHPMIRGTGQRPDIFMQNAVASHPYHANAARIVQETMDEVGALTGRPYKLFDYVGHPEATKVAVCMGSGATTVRETVDYMNSTLGEKVGLIKVRLYRPWDAEAFKAALPKSCTDVVVLDRTREDGALHGQPLYLDVSATLQRAGDTRNVVGGQYGLASKEFTPKHALACFQNVGAAEQKVSLQQC